MSLKPRTTRVVLIALLLGLLLLSLLSVPAPWSTPRVLRGTVIHSDLVLGSKTQGGSKGSISVHLADGSVVWLSTSRASLPAVSTSVLIEEHHGLFGQRLVTLVGR